MLFQPIKKSASQFLGKFPLRVILVIPFILQIFGTVGIVGYLSFKNSQKAVNDVANQLREEVTERVQHHLENYLHQPHLINNLNSNAAKRGDLTFDDFPKSQYFLWQQIQEFEAINSIYIASYKGQFIYVKNEIDGSFGARLVEEPPTRIHYPIDINGNLTEEIVKIDTYDPRLRPWYIKTMQTKQPNWSEIYNFTSGELGITASRLFYNQYGELQGVMGVDLVLNLISKFLYQVKISPNGQVFIMERSGFLVATSTTEKPFILKPNDPKAKRLKVSDSKQELTRAAGQFLEKNFSNLNAIKRPTKLDFKIDNQTKFLQIVPYEDKYGLDWLIVVIVPESDFMSQIEANNQTTIMLCLAALGIATLIGIVTSRWIVQPILSLKDAAISLSEGEFNRNVKLNRTDELGVLAKAFNSMAKQLQESFNNLEKKNAELEQLNKLKDEFLANTSHELRTPLNGIIGIGESLIDGVTGTLPDQTIYNLNLVVSSARRLSNLVNDILDFSKLRHKNIDLQIKPVGIREITDVVLTLSQTLIGQKDLKLINHLTVDLPMVDADENRLQQILYNLIGNGIKFTDAGTVEISAELLPNTEPDAPQQLAITISDTGIGISEDKFERIFESFEQGDGSSARVYGGTGLGLAVSKQLVELHGGKILVKSTVGVGSEFTFTLPVSQASYLRNSTLKMPTEDLISVHNKHSDKITNNQALTKEFTKPILTLKAALVEKNEGEFKVLIVDDEPINLQVLVNNLSLENYSITQANDGLEALELIENGFRPDLILLDVMMPRMTGYEVSQKLREKFLASELPIVMLTAKNQTSDLIEGFSSGANDYVSKPFAKNELLARIKTHLRLAKINEAYGRFVPHEFLKFLGHESIIDVKLGDHTQREMSILFADIRSFTTLSEGMSPQENFNFINEYLNRVSPVIRAHNGFIDKYIGDAIMALFYHSTDDALLGAIAMQKQVSLFNQEREKDGQKSISIGIGLHTGTLMLGTIGETRRMESTVISDAVNLASRLEGLTKVYGAGILISHQVLCCLDYLEEHNLRFLDRVMVKGKKTAVAIFEVYDGDIPEQKQFKMQTKQRFEVAVFLYYQQQFEEAKKIFQEILQVNSIDKAAMLYIKRCQKYQYYGVPEGWTGVEALDDK